MHWAGLLPVLLRGLAAVTTGSFVVKDGSQPSCLQLAFLLQLQVHQRAGRAPRNRQLKVWLLEP